MGEKHPIPLDILVDHLGVLAKTGAGKTFMTKGLVERLLDDKRRVCIIDPKNAWWGLKSSADGKSPGYAVTVFGGPNADLPLLATHGKILGEAVATSDMSCIICTKGMSEADRIRFLTDFLMTLNAKNEEPLHLVLDEAHLMAPQKPLGEMQRLTHWTAETVSGGRGMGLRVILISQRPARLNKDVLTQCESLVAMRMTGPQDRDAVRTWIHDQADVETGKEIVASLPTLKTGEGWFWAPAANRLERVKFPVIKTYDNSKTQRDAKQDAKAKLAPIDLADLEKRLGKAKDEIAANDPAALRRQVAELKRALHEATEYAARADNKAADAHFDAGAEYDRGVADGVKHMNTFWEGWRKGLKLTKVGDLLGQMHDIRAKLVEACAELTIPPVIPEPLNSGQPGFPPAHIRAEGSINTDPLRGGRPYSVHPNNVKRSPETNRALGALASTAAKQIAERQVVASGGDRSTRALDGLNLGKAERAILVAIAEWTDLGFTAPTNAQISAMSGYSATSSSFSNALGKLRSADIIKGTSLTAIGQSLVPMFDPVTTEQLRDRLLSLMGKAEKTIFELLHRNPQGLTRATLSEVSGYSLTSSSFSNALGALRNTFKVVDYQGDLVVPQAWIYVGRA